VNVSPVAFRELVAAALDGLPEQWQEPLGQVVVLVEEQASPDELEAAGFAATEGADLLGLYVGVPLTERGALDDGLPDRIMIYRLPILAICRSDAEVVQEVQDTVLHELGHYFGLLEDDLPF
jgi:predicted Zn-dependent protease with MMP-like domain